MGSGRRLRHSHHRRLIALIGAVILLTACSPFGESSGTPPTATLIPPGMVTPIFTPAPSTPDASFTPIATAPASPVATPLAAQDRAASLLQDEPGVYGFVVLDADGSTLVSWNGEIPFISASLYKLVLLADIFRRIESGEVHPEWLVVLQPDAFDAIGDMYFGFDEIGATFTVTELLYAAGAYSSNVAARSLMIYTSADDLRAMAVALGMESTWFFVDPAELADWPPDWAHEARSGDAELARRYLEASRAEGPVNITTPLDMARYQLQLANGTLVSSWVSEQIVAILEEQLIRDRIPAAVAESTRVINKPGNLEDAVHDVGVIYLPDGPVAIAVMSQAVPDPERAAFILRRLAEIAAG